MHLLRERQEPLQRIEHLGLPGLASILGMPPYH
jgi:hypothetical protein